MFRKKSEINGFVGFWYGQANEKKAELAKSIEESVKSLNTNADLALTSIKGAITEFVTACQGEYAEGYPDFLLTVKGLEVDDSIASIHVSVKTKLNSTAKYSEKETFGVKEGAGATIADFVINAMVQLYYREFANNNLIALTEVFAELKETYNLPFDVKFALEENGHVVSSVEENAIVFGGTLDGASAEDLMLIYTGDEYIDAKVAQNREKVGEALLSMPTIPVLLGNLKKVPVIGKIIEQPLVRKRPDKLIGQAYSKLESVKTEKERVATVTKEINDTKVFALVKKVGNDLSFVVKPFDVKTCASVEVSMNELVD